MDLHSKKGPACFRAIDGRRKIAGTGPGRGQASAIHLNHHLSTPKGIRSLFLKRTINSTIIMVFITSQSEVIGGHMGARKRRFWEIREFHLNQVYSEQSEVPSSLGDSDLWVL